ncbi:enoyl-CoA hydratase/isomerase family protein [Variovorax paradoxus]|jgi:enoyl-CoA hydratase|uniref:enoyl-CoA hydratase/isomerase family protein n=1 Tax=Variovorax paradoxus TaxID=34073 RepID=UPI003AAA4A96
MILKYEDFQFLLFEHRANGVLVVTINRPEKLNAANDRMLFEYAEVWNTVKHDAATRVVVITGAGRAFSAGGDLNGDLAKLGHVEPIVQMGENALNIVYNMVHLDKVIISAINGPAAGAGLALALTADISLIAEDAKITDAHSKIGVASGDHALMLWPLFCGLPKAKLYLLTANQLDGREAERIGLVSECMPKDALMPRALALADQLALGPQRAIRWTKRCLNHWVRQAAPIFDLSVAYEGLNFMEPDASEGLHAFVEKRAPSFPSAPPVPPAPVVD